MTVESQVAIEQEVCPKCGSLMVYRRRVSHNRIHLLLQCRVCRHFKPITLPD